MDAASRDRPPADHNPEQDNQPTYHHQHAIQATTIHGMTRHSDPLVRRQWFSADLSTHMEQKPAKNATPLSG
jgi:hypothetical protein